METTAKNIKMLKGQDSCSNGAIKSGEVHKVKVKSQVCYKCGKSNHITNKCHFIHDKCHNCGKNGQIIKCAVVIRRLADHIRDEAISD